MRTLALLAICITFALLTSCEQTQNNSTEQAQINSNKPAQDSAKQPANDSAAQAQNNTEEKANQLLKEFYTKYITAFATEPAGPENEKKIKELQKEYCTAAFFKKIPGIIEESEADPFLDAQDSNIAYLETLTIEKGAAKDEYIVSYIPKEDKIIVHVTVVKEGDSYKIDSVK
ncbi:DUF3828 domain-containing protein [Filimonas effusa]|uniref:DUF3828 domain-containing protein n=1 Tax=Filimonas effusa TaxID=2508721 RepID=A0A4V1M9T7_9BACT|nr:DUF3828 domain-containing protein [Filimonas effusa]RXK82814.1 DUF3828 domain-containing protein [Filimonas effusa]